MTPQLFDKLTENATAALEHGREAARRTGTRRGHGRIAGWVKLKPAVDAIIRRGNCSQEDERTIRAAAKDTRDLARSLRRHPLACAANGEEMPRACVVAQDFLTISRHAFREAELAAFLNGYQEVAELEMGELRAIKPALQLAVLQELNLAAADEWPQWIGMLRQIEEAGWKELFESVSLVDRVLAHDPMNAYCTMDYDSRDRYRRVIASLARHSNCTEREAAEQALGLARQVAAANLGESRAAIRRAHVGYYLIDDGLHLLRAAIRYRRTWRDRVTGWILRHRNLYYVAGIEVLTFVLVALLLSGLGPRTPILGGLLLLLIPASQAAVDFMNHLTAFLLGPRRLARLDFSGGIPVEFTTAVAVPALLLNEEQVRDLVLDLEIRFLANRDPNLLFVLLTDSPDSGRPGDEADALAAIARQLIEGLNQRYSSEGHSPFYLFHQDRTDNGPGSRWTGWERKRGKLLDFNRYLRGGGDGFTVKTGDLEALRRVKYIITLDTGTRLPRDAARKLIGAIAHPLNRAVIHPATRVVVEGYGILQPRIGISIHSPSRSRLAALYSFDTYGRSASDTYQDLFGEGIFTGKGIYEVDVLRETLEQRFPENALLTHDLIEGAYARTALVSDIELIDDYLSHLSAYSGRQHRWVRGDWQIMHWLRNHVPDCYGQYVLNPMNLISRWKILDNLRRSLLAPAMLALFLAAWLYLAGPVRYWTAAAIATLFLPVYWQALFALPRMRGKAGFFSWLKNTCEAFVKGHLAAMLSLVFLLHQSLLSLDAMVRSTLGLFVTRKRLLQRETAAESELAARRRTTADIYLAWTPVIAILIGFMVRAVRPQAWAAALPVIVLWFLSRAISGWLNRAPRTSHRGIAKDDVALLRDSAGQMCRFFAEWSSPATNWLIPDRIREDGIPALQVSPTSLGLLLNARIAAVHFGHLSMEDFTFCTEQTLEVANRLQKYRGHLLSQYDAATLEPLEPRFVSTVGSGNLVACLWTLKQAALAFAKKHGTLAARLCAIAEACDRMAREMDFGFLYMRRGNALSAGCRITGSRPESLACELLSSELRMANFVAIAKGDIPQEAWFRLGRGQCTMPEYLMPALWMHNYPGAITEHSGKTAMPVQRDNGSMAHDQGISLLALCNLLCDGAIQRYFHDEPHVMAAEPLLHEHAPGAGEAEMAALR